MISDFQHPPSPPNPPKPKVCQVTDHCSRGELHKHICQGHSGHSGHSWSCHRKLCSAGPRCSQVMPGTAGSASLRRRLSSLALIYSLYNCQFYDCYYHCHDCMTISTLRFNYNNNYCDYSRQQHINITTYNTL